ncbi:sulfatase [Haloferula sp.]|uniref:sulfatase n=1 Tax=Haloferula sp. TaxID=2497595 RepID=UPI00329F6412
MKRRVFIRAAVFSCIALLTAAPASLFAATGAGRRPNVLFLISDDLTCALSGYGRRQCETPHIDQLASRGVQFDHAYTMNPVCGPARAAIMSGLSPWTTGVMGNYYNKGGQDTLRRKVRNLVTLPQFLRQEGYHTARVSKIYHMGIPGEILEGTAHADDKKSWDVAENVKALEQHTPGVSEDLSPAMKHQGVDFIRVEADGDDTLHADRMAADKAIAMMPELAKSEKPFFLGVGLVRPHVPLVAPKRFFKPFPFDKMILAPKVENDHDDVPGVALKMKNFPRYGMSVEQQKKALSAYHASVGFMDAQVGRVLKALEKHGLNDNTIVVFMSDHGWNLGEHDCWQKLSLWEDSIRTPLIIVAPGQSVGKRCARIVEHVDLYPTLVELCGYKPPEGLAGQSLVPLLSDPSSAQWNDKAAYTVTYNGSGESLRTDAWHLNLWSDGNEGIELYDVKNDPGEFVNLAKDSAHRETLEGLSNELRARRSKFNGKVPDSKNRKKRK